MGNSIENKASNVDDLKTGFDNIFLDQSQDPMVLLQALHKLVPKEDLMQVLKNYEGMEVEEKELKETMQDILTQANPTGDPYLFCNFLIALVPEETLKKVLEEYKKMMETEEHNYQANF